MMFRLKFRNNSITKIFKRYYNSEKRTNPQDSIRNIGILAHIDAGKTTTTERMLFYSGKTRNLGEVHHGTTVTDYLDQERERGITICSSAVTFMWKDHRINLLDTPGHIDFTMEVEQSLGAVDGCVVILDSSAGVEAQTVTVWNQSDRYELPKIIFANKMDRADADFEGCVEDVRRKLHECPIPLQFPFKIDGKLKGIIDLLTMKKVTWDVKNQGQSYKVEDIRDNKEMKEKRLEIVDKLSGIDDQLAEKIIVENSLETISLDVLLNSLRRQTIRRKIVPMFLGSAYKNTGVQLLMDNIINFLPAPNDRNQVYDCFDDNFVGTVFKVTHDKQRGALSLVRIFRGEIKKGARITTSNGKGENIQKIYEPLADEYKEIDSIGAGNVCAFAGLKSTKTGDVLVSSASSLKNAQSKLEKNSASEHSTFSLEPNIPDAVYFCSIEPPSVAYQTALDNALEQIQREDPSLRVKYDETTLQTVLGGMGELHLEIIKSRLLTEYKIDADLGPLQIAYKETIEDEITNSIRCEKEIAGNKQLVEIGMTLDVKQPDEKEIFRLDNSPEASEILTPIRPKYIQLVKKAAISALDRGPKIGGEVINVKIKLNNLVIGRGTADAFIMSAATQCVQKIFLQGNSRLLEPMMSIQIIVPSEKVSPVLADLGRRRAQILNVSIRGENNRVIDIIAPLAELTGYSSIVRTMTSGTASMSMQPHGYNLLSISEQESAIRRAQGLE